MNVTSRPGSGLQPRRFEITIREVGSDDNVIIAVPALEFAAITAADAAASISLLSHTELSLIVTNGLLETTCRTLAQNRELRLELANAKFKARKENVDV